MIKSDLVLITHKRILEITTKKVNGIIRLYKMSHLEGLVYNTHSLCSESDSYFSLLSVKEK